eukprot:m.34858 g.34858  ORF g.34858 m.34858 type:complete len:192 (+) comp9822_c0_seq1:375-950(+)
MSGHQEEGLEGRFERRETYQQHWSSGFWSSPCEDPGFCLLSLFCSQCVSYHLRSRYLKYDLSRYECCAGEQDLPMECCYCRDTACPWFWLGVETTFCHPMSMMGTRNALQDDLQLENTCADKSIFCLMFGVRLFSCLFRSCGCLPLANFCEAQANNCFLCVCACIQTQTKLQLDARDYGDTAHLITKQPYA